MLTRSEERVDRVDKQSENMDKEKKYIYIYFIKPIRCEEYNK